jgi:hypothetical protein
MAERSQVKVVAAVDPESRRTTRLGIGLLAALAVGWPSLYGAVQGSVSLEGAVVRFLITVAASVAGVLFVGALRDQFVAENLRAEALARQEAARARQAAALEAAEAEG